MEEYNWVQYAAQHQPQQARPLEIKVEPSLDSTSFSLISPPSSPSAYPGPRSASGDPGPFPAPIRRRSNNSIASPKRAKPYPILTRELRLRTEESGAMGHQPYDTWSPTSMRDVSTVRPHFSVQVSPSRSSSEGGDQRTPSSYTLSNALVSPQSLSVPHIDTRPQSASSNMTTSSLTGAMGDTHISANSCSPSPTDGPAYNMQRVAWDADQAHAPVAQHHYSTNHAVNRSHEPNMQYREAPSSGSMPNTSYTPFDYHHHTSESISPRSGDLPSLYSDSQQYSYHPVRPHPTIQTRSLAAPEPSDPYETISPMSPDDPRPPPQWNSHEQYEEEIQFLQRKVRELELINESARLRQKDLERELAKDLSGASQSQSHVSSSSSHGLPSPILTPSPQTAGFHASWQARTEARVRHFCSLNRAGNALCAWHDSRRERRAYPPRMAPPGRLNCGCTHAEALFEESLSRHGVGSYHPGESVRMDPALRNPLLKLLQTRYGYRDGDFERDITTGEWVEGEGHSIWEHNAITGVPAYRKK